ncbi:MULTISPECIES: MarR family transcriptional regulator [Actinoplanes]|uniref:MarR family winged helix-turn-helix transcriptional regulator n=1 Tax=Actinoplanes TaxID=1865 RepID=UPI0005F294E1|nr:MULTISPECIES: MarR family transcriptional regulator [Actinoplanes]GLY08692.1 hypothetical protein Acsp01_90710 [Actinoplanes sp. NBRC 101535]
MTDRHPFDAGEQAARARIGQLGPDLDLDAARTAAAVHRAAAALRAHVTAEVLRPHDLSWTGFAVLRAVWIGDGLETRYAADAAAVSKATLTGVVRTLQSRGLLAREPRHDDRRLVQLRLTPAGAALLREIYPRFNAIESRVMGGLPARRSRELTAGLRTIVTGIERLRDVAGA